jgi:hypothetical protein
MKRFIVPGIITAACLILITGCYYDNEEALYPELNAACDTVNVTFSATIAPIISNNCLSCHSDANAAFGGNVHLQSLADVMAISARIMPSIEQTGPKPMPPNGKLRPCSITQFRIWINNGMPGK